MSETAESRKPQKASPTTHAHAWRHRSRHLTSTGWVLYVRCADCGANAVSLQPFAPTVVWGDEERGVTV